MFTRFEVARLLGARTLQVALGAPVLVKTELKEPSNIAKQEFREGMMPITIKRKLPSGEEIVIDVKAAIKNWLSEGREI
jgi:DNA-directed RNA polymerase subunit K